MGGHERLADYLRTEGVEYTVRQHAEAYTAQEVAAADHIPGHLFMKVVMVFADDGLAMLCMPTCPDRTGSGWLLMYPVACCVA